MASAANRFALASNLALSASSIGAAGAAAAAVDPANRSARCFFL